MLTIEEAVLNIVISEVDNSEDLNFLTDLKLCCGQMVRSLYIGTLLWDGNQVRNVHRDGSHSLYAYCPFCGTEIEYK